MPQRVEDNELLRRQGWRVFRSSTRDRVIPSTGAGGSLQRIRLAQALPVASVEVGAAVSMEEREVRAVTRTKAMEAAHRQAEARPLGVTKVLSYRILAPVAFGAAGVESEEEFVVAVAPFDGFITEMLVVGSVLGASLAFAVRTSGGESIFKTFDTAVTTAFVLNHEPDFINEFGLSGGAGQTVLRNLRVPVYAGEQILYRVRVNSAIFVGDDLGAGALTFEGFVLARQGSQAAVSQFGALLTESRRAATEAANNAGRLAVERERTRRAEIEANGRVAAARALTESRRPASQPAFNPFQGVLVAPQAQEPFSRRERPVPPAPPPFAAPSAAIGGEGKTFVQSWMGSQDGIGYLTPTPPAGGRVTVFDSKYSVWDVTGRQVSQGQVEVVRSSEQIPPGARISRNLGVTPSAGMAVSLGGPGGFEEGQVFQTTSGRTVVGPVR